MKSRSHDLILQQEAKADLDSNDMPDLHVLPGKHVEKDSLVGAEGIEKVNDKPVPEGWKPSPAEERAGKFEVSEPEASMSMGKDRPVPEGWKSSPAEERAGECEVSEPEASMSMSVTGGT
jgi:hypothetical protein